MIDKRCVRVHRRTGANFATIREVSRRGRMPLRASFAHIALQFPGQLSPSVVCEKANDVAVHRALRF